MLCAYVILISPRLAGVVPTLREDDLVRVIHRVDRRRWRGAGSGAAGTTAAAVE